MSSLFRFGAAVLVFSALIAAIACGGSSPPVHQSSANNPAPSPTTPAPSPAPTISLAAQPATISSGSSTTLTWNTSNATSVTITGIGTVADAGSQKVSPSVTTTYTAAATGTGGTVTSSATVTVTATPTPPGVPQFGHVFLLVEENHSYSSVIGNSAMPYFNSLAKQYGLATQYFANTHPSIGNYLMLTTGQIITNDDAYSGTVNADNLVRHFLSAGKNWRSYAESLPTVGYIGGDVYPYVKHHNPFSYFTDVVNSQNQLNNLVPFSQFASDLSSNQLPQFSFIVPNMLDDAHDGSLNQADGWLSTHIAPLIASSTFQQDGLLIIVFDESFDSDTQGGGGQVAAVIISAQGKKGYQSTAKYQHQSTCELVLQALGANSFPGACQGAPQMTEFF
jgi:phosphatidylinositol-3-phosphatase